MKQGASQVDKRWVSEITPKAEDFSKWYLDVVRKAELADYGSVKGCMIIRPYGYGIWERARDHLDRRIKETGHENAYFPLFLPESALKKEADHVKGFAPEVAWVTRGGGEELEEPLAVRPTSEAIICPMYAKWIRSYRDLPVLINQWANVVRWEKVTRPFLRTTEFLWQEGHTVHATAEEAEEETLKMLEVYRDFYETDLAVPVVKGEKTASERFAGALRTYAIEALMTDGRALQAGTSHNLGQHFAKAFGITFEDEKQELQHGWSTSWGVSTRLIGAVIMTHGDDSGLVVPPHIAPIQVVIVPISAGNWRETVLPHARDIFTKLRAAGIRCKLDDRDMHTPGWKYADWEMRGVPVRCEIGPKDIQKHQVVLVRRDSREKLFVPIDGLDRAAADLLEQIQTSLFQRACEYRDKNTTDVDKMEVFEELMERRPGFLRSFWCGGAECEAEIKARTSATIRVVPFGSDSEKGVCIHCNGEATNRVLFAKAY